MLKSEQIDEILKRFPCKQSLVKDDIDTITYHQDVFMAGDIQMMFRHIDIDFCYGDYLEIKEEDALFAYIMNICKIKETAEEASITLYQKE